VIEIKTGDDIETKLGVDAALARLADKYIAGVQNYLKAHGDIPLNSSDILMLRMAYETGYLDGLHEPK
jgi:hypothetical protein